MKNNSIKIAGLVFGIALTVSLSACSTTEVAPAAETAASSQSASKPKITLPPPMTGEDALAIVQSIYPGQCSPDGLWASLGGLVVEGPMTGENPYNSTRGAEYPNEENQYYAFNVWSASMENMLFQVLVEVTGTGYSVRGLFSNPDGINMDIWGCLPEDKNAYGERKFPLSTQ